MFTVATEEEAIGPTDDSMPFEGGPTHPPRKLKVGGENPTLAPEVTPPTAGNIEEAGEEVNSPVR